MAKRTDSRKEARHPVNGETLQAAVGWAIDARIFAHLKVHGNTTWQFVDLVLLTIVWVWSGDAKLTGAFAEAHRWSLQVLGRAAVGTFQGLLKALVRWTAKLVPLLTECLHGQMEEHGGEHWRVGLWLALAVDGSRTSVPRTEANERAFGAPNYGHSKTAKYRRKKAKGKRRRRKAKEKMQPVKPQIWLTLLWHMGLHMPWGWKTGPSYASERDHFRALLAEQQFPENTLFCADAGFTGYDLWRAMIDAGHSFLIRVGSNVRLLRRLGYVRESQGVVYFWPDHAARRHQPPLVLRLFALQVGRCAMWMVTNVLDEDRLTDTEAVRLYQFRWGIELQFRTVKQTFGRRKLRSRTPERAYVELDWSLVGLWLIQLFAVTEQVAIGEVPEHCSVGLAIQVVRTMLQRWSEHADASFESQLRAATKDRYRRQRGKRARYRLAYKDQPAAGSPKVQTATRKHKTWLREYLQTAA
jgi:Transposase DDE domain